MQRPITSLLAVSLVGIAGLGACTSDPPSPTTVRSRISSDLGNVLHESAAAGDGTTKTLPTGAFDLLGKALGVGGSASSTTSLRIAELTRHLPHATTRGASATPASGFDPDAIIDQLDMTIFTNANEVEPGIYAIPADLACSVTSVDSSGATTTSLDPDCAASWDKLVLRVRVEQSGSALVFAIQLGAAHDEPLEISLTHTSLAISVDLDQAGAAAIAIAQAFGEQAPNAHLSGKVTGTLTILGTAHADVAFSIDRALDIAVADQGVDLSGADAFRMTSAAAHVIDVDLDGGAGSGALDLGLGATTIHTPGTSSFDLDLPGATAQVDLAAGQPLHLSHVGLGDRTTTLSKHGAIGLSIDLNPNDGRAFDATITPDAAAGTETLAISPKLDARMTTNHAVLGDEPGVYDVTRVLFDGSLRAGDASGQVQVLSGTFGITTNPAQYGFSAAAGQCVTGDDVYDSATGSTYTQWATGACL
jgi:hypothetical protein